MSFLERLFGSKQAVGSSSQASPMQEMLATQRANTEKCIRILGAGGNTKPEVLKAFSTAAALLSQTEDPFAESLHNVAAQGGALSIEQLLDLRKNCIAKCEAFLSATEGGI